jgi:ferredoxin-thioredoxin reductase catalytic subunit
MVDIEYVKANIKEGWQLNPNEKVVNGIIKGINRCGGDCPCANTSEELKCPCSGYRLNDKCCCNLYVKIQ